MKRKTDFLTRVVILQMLQELLRDKPSIRYLVKVSKTSLSIYIRFYYDTCFVTRRISNHISSKGISTLLVNKGTKYKQVETFIQSAIQQLCKKHIYYLINKFTEL